LLQVLQQYYVPSITYHPIQAFRKRRQTTNAHYTAGAGCCNCCCCCFVHWRRWDALSSSLSADSSSDDDESSTAALPCEQLLQQHEALQRQQQLACLPRRDKALAADPRHQAQQTRLAIQGLAADSDDSDVEEQRALALQFEQPAKKGEKRGLSM
jgi:hypothetical protein